ncbi:MAG: peptide ABC transporter substrate-binding protein [Clostridia bacterium]|nr:peptide ABC transporter substrate-binding protein [Clostridia bacterium]
MKKLVALLLTAVLSLSCVLSVSAESAKTSMNVCIASEPDTLDPALNSAVDGATMIAHLFSGLAAWSQDENGALVIVPDCAKELPAAVINEDGTATYTYTLVDGLKWSDGKDVTAKDFEFAWKRAASEALAADYGYMFEVVKGYPNELAVEATDDKTLVVTLNNDVSYWNELLAFPTFLPVREDVVASEAWATAPETYICNGAYTMTKWDHNSVITLSKNANYNKADTVKMDEINFYLSDDANNMLANYENGDWQMIDDVPNNEIATLKEKYPTEFVVGSQMGTYYVCWNVNANILPADTTLTGEDAEKAMAEIRFALGLLFDRNYIVTEIGQAGQQPASSFVALGLTDANGIDQFYKNAGSADDSYAGYWDTAEDAYAGNWDKAIEILKKYYAFDEATQQFTNFPSIEYLYNTSEGHKAIGEYLAQVLSGVGITCNLVNQEWNTFLNTRKNGDYVFARNGWLADYNDPISFLDMWTSSSGNDDTQLGKDAHKDLKLYSIDLTAFGSDLKVENGTWAETYDAAIAAIKACGDKDARYGMMHAAEDLVMSTGTITPLYYYTDIYMIKENVKGFFSNPLGYKYFMYCEIQ